KPQPEAARTTMLRACLQSKRHQAAVENPNCKPDAAEKHGLGEVKKNDSCHSVSRLGSIFRIRLRRLQAISMSAWTLRGGKSRLHGHIATAPRVAGRR